LYPRAKENGAFNSAPAGKRSVGGGSSAPALKRRAMGAAVEVAGFPRRGAHVTPQQALVCCGGFFIPPLWFWLAAPSFAASQDVSRAFATGDGPASRAAFRELPTLRGGPAPNRGSVASIADGDWDGVADPQAPGL
jgi:hypothetical protein